MQHPAKFESAAVQKFKSNNWKTALQKCAKLLDVENCCNMNILTLLPKSGFDTAENGPRQVRCMITSRAREPSFEIVSVEVSVNTLDEEMRTVLDSMKEANAPKDAKQSVLHLMSLSLQKNVLTDREKLVEYPLKCQTPRGSVCPDENDSLR